MDNQQDFTIHEDLTSYLESIEREAGISLRIDTIGWDARDASRYPDDPPGTVRIVDRCTLDGYGGSGGPGYAPDHFIEQATSREDWSRGFMRMDTETLPEDVRVFLVEASSDESPEQPVAIVDEHVVLVPFALWPLLNPSLSHDDALIVKDRLSDWLEPAIRHAGRAALDTDRAQQQRERLAASLATWLESHGGQAVEDLRTRLRNVEHRASSHRDILDQAMEEAREISLQIAAVLDVTDEVRQRRIDQAVALMDHPRLTSVRIDRDVLRLRTDPIVMDWPGRLERVRLGCFDVAIHLGTGTITYRNLETRRGERDHPHIVEGRACFGNLDGVIRSMWIQGDLAGVVEVGVFGQLTTFNPDDDYGRYASYWFEDQGLRLDLATDEQEIAA